MNTEVIIGVTVAALIMAILLWRADHVHVGVIAGLVMFTNVMLFWWKDRPEWFSVSLVTLNIIFGLVFIIGSTMTTEKK